VRYKSIGRNGGSEVIERLGNVLYWVGLFTALTASMQATAAAVLDCTETIYDETGNNPYEVHHYTLFDEGGYLSRAKLLWDDEDLNFNVTKITPGRIEAEVATTAYMPNPRHIDECIAAEMAKRPNLTPDNEFLWLDCQRGEDLDRGKISIILAITINRINGQLTIDRRQNTEPRYNTERYGSCTPAKSRF
jgi:hypothetical protein